MWKIQNYILLITLCNQPLKLLNSNFNPVSKSYKLMEFNYKLIILCVKKIPVHQKFSIIVN